MKLNCKPNLGEGDLGYLIDGTNRFYIVGLEDADAPALLGPVGASHEAHYGALRGQAICRGL